MNIVHIPIDQIRHRADARPRSDDALTSLAESIEAVGLINPIRVRRRGDHYEVTTGSHRLQAVDLLGWATIACVVVDDDDVQAELAMIAENLHRAELNADQRRQQLRRYAELVAARADLQSRQDVAIESKREDGRGHRPEGIASQVARETGVSVRTVQRAMSDKPPAPAVRNEQRGGIAGRYAPASDSAPAPDTFDRFLRACDVIDAVEPSALIASAGRQRAVLGQRASSLADHLTRIVEGLEP